VSEHVVEFDVAALFEALDGQRLARGLSWRGVADEMWNMSHVLNSQRNDHPISPATLTNMAKMGSTSCQHALFMLHWLDRTPESFLTGAHESVPEASLPEAGPDRRLRWRLLMLYTALDSKRRARALTWPELARELRCTPNQLTGIRVAKFAIGMKLAMRITQWLERPAADFIYAAKW
jgi:hypothetical protein